MAKPSAGFKNAIIAKIHQPSEEDPDFSPEDARYPVIRYVASTTRNAGDQAYLIQDQVRLSRVNHLYHNHTFVQKLLFVRNRA
jgi:hypothetical protein